MSKSMQQGTVIPTQRTESTDQPISHPLWCLQYSDDERNMGHGPEGEHRGRVHHVDTIDQEISVQIVRGYETLVGQRIDHEPNVRVTISNFAVDMGEVDIDLSESDAQMLFTKLGAVLDLLKRTAEYSREEHVPTAAEYEEAAETLRQTAREFKAKAKQTTEVSR